VAQGCLFKSASGHWQFGVRRDLHPGIKNNITADALRLITGHTQAFKPLHKPMASRAVASQIFPSIVTVAAGLAPLRL
jgi:hypothetical protein